MKSYFKFTALLLALFAFSTVSKAQSNSNNKSTPIASDAPSGYTYDYNKVVTLITERIATPSKSNSDVQVFLDHKDFPKITPDKINDLTAREQLRIWIEKNPDLIINTLKHRKDIVTPY